MSWEDYREFELVYRENARLVYRFLVSRGCPPQEAEDLTQDTFVKALLHILRVSWVSQVFFAIWHSQTDSLHSPLRRRT